jgi:DNA invertase Pin-like site-specific DNA recombinase
MARIGYGCVSAADQDPGSERAGLEAAGCERVFADEDPRRLARRPQREACMAALRRGDELVITRLSRLAGSLRDLLGIAVQLRERGIGLVVLQQAIDTTTPRGQRALAVIVDAIGEFQRERIAEGTHAGLAAGRARGRKGGRPPALSAGQAARARALYDEKGDDGRRAHTVADIAAALGVSRSTIYAHLDPRGRS